MYISTGQFVHDVLPGLMRGRDSFSVLLSTYQDLDMPPAHEIPAGLSMRALTGCPMTVEEARKRLQRLMQDPEADQERYNDERRRGLHAVASAPLPSEGFDLGVVYLGLTQFKRAVPYAQGLVRKGTVRAVAVLTCDCDAARKAYELEPLVKDGTFRCAILTPRCGGCSDMREVAEGLIEVWPQVRAT